MQFFNNQDINQLDKIYKINLINSCSGFKSANLLGAISEDGKTNVAVFSSVTHLGSNPPTLGFILRPTTVPRNTHKNIKDLGFFTINHIYEDIIDDKQVMELMSVESVTAGLITLCDKDAPNRTILCAGAGGYAATHIYETDGIFLPAAQQTPENVRANMDAIHNADGEKMLMAGFEQTNKFVEKAVAFIKSQT